MARSTSFPNHLLDAAARQQLGRRRNGPAIARLAAHLATLGVTGVLVWSSRGTWWVAPGLVVHGIVLVFLFAPLHETIHDTAFRTRALNRWVAAMLGTALLLPANYFRHFHAAHHRLTNIPGDPELSGRGRETVGDYLWHLSGWPLWRERVSNLLRHALGRGVEPFVPRYRRRAIVYEARVTLRVYVALGAAGWSLGCIAALLWLWVLPMLVGQPFLRVFLLAEHGGRPQTPDMLRNSRTTRSTAVVRALAWNMPYHSEHHAFPWVPFHALPALHTRIKQDLVGVAPSYAGTLIGLLRAAR
jgi:fatty acid desaturase